MKAANRSEHWIRGFVIAAISSFWSRLISSLVIGAAAILLVFLVWSPGIDASEETTSRSIEPDEENYIDAVRNGLEVTVPVASFYKVASWCLTNQADLEVVIEEAIELLDPGKDYFSDGGNVKLSLAGGGSIFLNGLTSRGHLENAQSGVHQALSCVSSTMTGVSEHCSEIDSVGIVVVGTSMLYFIDGLSGVGDNTSVGLDLRSRWGDRGGPQRSSDTLPK